MPLDFSTIHFDLKMMIAKKIDFWTLIDFQLSSKEGKIIGDKASSSVILLLNQIHFEDRYIGLTIENPRTKREVIKHWQDIRKYQRLPIFSVKFILKLPNTSLDYLNSFANEIRIAKRKGRLSWGGQEKDENELFLKFVEMFNVTEFLSLRDDSWVETTVIHLPQFWQLDDVVIPVNNLPDEVFLKLKARSIHHTHRDANWMAQSVVNKFLRQWFLKEREIQSLWVRVNDYSSFVELFYKLPVILLFSNSERVPFGDRLYERYLLDRGDVLLHISIISCSVHITAVDDKSHEAEEYKEKAGRFKKTEKTEEEQSGWILWIWNYISSMFLIRE